jgi:hypothetical protein
MVVLVHADGATMNYSDIPQDRKMYGLKMEDSLLKRERGVMDTRLPGLNPVTEIRGHTVT